MEEDETWTGGWTKLVGFLICEIQGLERKGGSLRKGTEHLGASE